MQNTAEYENTPSRFYADNDVNNLREVLKFSAQMLSKLRASKLSPHHYYELYMRAFDELKRLEMFFQDEKRHDASFIGLYEMIPRVLFCPRISLKISLRYVEVFDIQFLASS